MKGMTMAYMLDYLQRMLETVMELRMVIELVIQLEKVLDFQAYWRETRLVNRMGSKKAIVWGLE